MSAADYEEICVPSRDSVAHNRRDVSALQMDLEIGSLAGLNFTDFVACGIGEKAVESKGEIGRRAAFGSRDAMEELNSRGELLGDGARPLDDVCALFFEIECTENVLDMGIRRCPWVVEARTGPDGAFSPMEHLSGG